MRDFPKKKKKSCGIFRDDRNIGFEEGTLVFKGIVNFIDWGYVLLKREVISNAWVGEKRLLWLQKIWIHRGNCSPSLSLEERQNWERAGCGPGEGILRESFPDELPSQPSTTFRFLSFFLWTKISLVCLVSILEVISLVPTLLLPSINPNSEAKAGVWPAAVW